LNLSEEDKKGLCKWVDETSAAFVIEDDNELGYYFIIIIKNVLI